MSCNGCGGTVVQSTRGVQGPPGSCTPLVEILYADLLTLKNTSALVPATIYHIIDKGIYVQALTINGLETEATLRATNADYNNVTGNFIGVWKGTTTIEYNTLVGGFQNGEIVTGGTSGATGEITIDFNNFPANSFFCMNVISKNGTTFQVAETLTGSTSGATCVTVSATATSILGSIAINKIVAWNNLHYVNTTSSGTIKHPKYDTTNWTLLATTDVSYQIEYDEIIYNLESDLITSRRDKRGNIVVSTDSFTGGVSKFQWGNNNTFSNEIYSFGFVGWNAATPYQEVFCQDATIYVGDTANINYLNTSGRSTNIFLGASDCQAALVHHGQLLMTGGFARHSYVRNFSAIVVLPGTVASDSTYFGINIILRGTSSITGCSLDNGESSATITFTSENHANQYFKRSVSSTFDKSLTQANGLTILTLDSSLIYGVYNLTITGGTASIDTIANMPSMPVQINAVTSNPITFVNNGAGPIQLKGGANKTLYPGNADWIVFQNISAIIQEVNSSIGSSLAVSNTLFVSKNGNDTTGTVGLFNRPFLSIAAAQTVASSGQTIIVYPGTYTDIGLGKAGVNYHFINGAIITGTSSNIWINTSSISYTVTGEGEFTTTSGKVIFLNNAGTVLFSAKSISNTSGFLINTSSTSKLYINVQKDITSASGYCFLLQSSAEVYANANLMSSGNILMNSGSATTICYLTSDTIVCTGSTAMFDATGTLIVKGQMNYTGAGVAIGSSAGLPCIHKFYGDLQNNNSSFCIQYNPGTTGTIDFHGKIIGIGYCGKVDSATYTFYDELTTNLTGQPCISMTTGTVKIVSTRLTNLDNTASSYGIIVGGGTLILQNAIIITSGGTQSVNASSTTKNIKIIGTLSSNVAKDVNIIDLCGGILQVDTDIS